jgi:hypothetical protein
MATDGTGTPRGRSAVTAGAYAVLFVLGGTEGVFGSFQYSRLPPRVAILACGVIFLTCVVGAWRMESVTGAFMPAAAWIIASFALSTQPVHNGSVIITNTTAGKWYLYGGTLSVALAVLLAFTGVLGTRRP